MNTNIKKIISWVERSIGVGARVVSVEPLRRETGTWRLRIATSDDILDARLKSGPIGWRAELACEVAALALAEGHGLTIPRLLAVDLDGEFGSLALLTTLLPGSTTIPRVATAERLHAVGAAAAEIHRIPLTPSRDLPLRERHMPWVDFSSLRRTAIRFQAAPDRERPKILDELLLQYGWERGELLDTLMDTRSTPLLDKADQELHELSLPETDTVFVHGDLWQGNLLWEDDRCVGIIDWEAAGAGHYGVDLGSLRWDAALLFGLPAAAHVLRGWEESSGRAAQDVAYWDLVSGLNTPAEVSGKAMSEAGRPDLDARVLTERRDDFLRDALNRLDS